MTEVRLTRRKLLGVAAGAASAAALGTRNRASAARPTTAHTSAPNHLAWVWVFKEDGNPYQVRNVLANNGLGVLLKTHDGNEWMGEFDDGASAIKNEVDVFHAAHFFETAGVPFHAWCVVKGLDPLAEARMCDAVLRSGARSITFDLEPPEGKHYWQATPREAIRFGQELRRLQPDAWLSFAPDPRPWQAAVVPMAEFATFCNEIAPQTYWDTFNSSANYKLLRDWGTNVGPDGLTPELLLDVTHGVMAHHGRPIKPVGQGASHPASWQRFVSHAYRLGMPNVSVWRYGTASLDVLSVLRDMPSPAAQPPAQPPAPEPAPAPAVEPAPTPAPAAEASFERQPSQPASSAADPASKPAWNWQVANSSRAGSLKSTFSNVGENPTGKAWSWLIKELP